MYGLANNVASFKSLILRLLVRGVFVGQSGVFPPFAFEREMSFSLVCGDVCFVVGYLFGEDKQQCFMV